METIRSGRAVAAEYTRWLQFLTTSRETIRRYDRRLRRLGNQHPDLIELTNYLRTCHHERSQFLGQVVLLLTGQVAQLRAEPANERLIRRMARAQPAMQTLMDQFSTEFSGVEESYRTLLSTTTVTNTWPCPVLA